jgi:hypothetical protein
MRGIEGTEGYIWNVLRENICKALRSIWRVLRDNIWKVLKRILGRILRGIFGRY